MSVIWIAPDAADKVLFLKKITDATGIQFEDEGSSNTKITFPDGKNITINYTISSGTVNIDKCRALVDLNKDLFIIYSNVSAGYNIKVGDTLINFIDVGITKSNGNLCRMSTDMSYFNVPTYAKSDDSKNTLTIVPVFEGNSVDYRFYDDIYINYERRFPVGLKFIDQNGNKFLTLGSYLLYKVD